MRAVIMAGGKGTRLRPYTTTIPKPIVPIADMAIMEIVIRQLVRCGFDRVTVAVSHLAQIIMAYFGDGSRWGLEIDYAFEDEPLGTIGPLRSILDLPDHFLVMNGDVLTDLDFGDLFRYHQSNNALATIATYVRRVQIDFGVIEFGKGDRRVSDFKEKPVEEFNVCMGVSVYSRDVLQYLPDTGAFGFDDLVKRLIEDAVDTHVYPYSGYWLDIGRPTDYERANEEFESVRERLLPVGD